MDPVRFFEVLVNIFVGAFCQSIEEHFDHEVEPVNVHNLKSGDHDCVVEIAVLGIGPTSNTKDSH